MAHYQGNTMAHPVVYNPQIRPLILLHTHDTNRFKTKTMNTSLFAVYRLKIMGLIPFLILTATILTSCYPPLILEQKINSGSDVSLTEVNQSSPEETVLSFYEAMDNGDIDMMKMLIDPNDESSNLFVKGFVLGLEQGIAGDTIDIEVNIVEETDALARVRSYFYETTYKNDELLWEGSNGGWFTLVKKDGKWYFIGLADPVPPGWILDK